ncbi:MAG TPA: family 16 glycosylhydrolase [bacterium]|nr:family 16 glycosylhydrolase [bacterium]
MTTTLEICAVLTTLLSVYSLGHYLCAGVFLFGRTKRKIFADSPTDAVAILIPAKNEAERALRAITSLVQQDYAGLVEIYLLLKDASDSSIAFLKALYPAANFEGQTVELLRTDSRRVVVAFTGSDPKSEKVNWMVARLQTKFLGILDADHQADPDWLRTSLCLLKERGARLIQGRRAPISARGFFLLWDSLHQHIGCELFNVAFTRLGLTVFFTGTTAVMETELLRANPLSDCITEDIDFSYATLLQGVRAIDNPHSGSSEETSPNLYSFLARRRRWANGHTQTFLRHFQQLSAAPLTGRERFQFVYHGLHYLVSVLVFVLHLLIGLFFIRALSPTSQGAAILASLLLGGWIARTQRTIGAVARATEIAVMFLWILPAIVIAMNLAQSILIHDIARSALPIPYALQAVGLVGLCAPPIVLLCGLAGFGQLSAETLLTVVVTYPIAFYLDICGVLLGMADCVIGRARWRPVSRAQEIALPGIEATRLLPTLGIRESWRLASLLQSSRTTMKMRWPSISRPSRLAAAGALVALFVVGVLYQPGSRIGVAQGSCEAMAQDDYPWITPVRKLTGYCSGAQTEPATRTGTFKLVHEDDLTSLDPAFWDRVDQTFPCNLAAFSPANAVTSADHGLQLTLDHTKNGDREYTSGSIATKPVKSAEYTYGRFETVMKPAKTSGVITAFFLYRFDPWQEIDAEFLGRDTTKMLINVYYNPGEEGDLYNYGFLGTPVLVDLGFDASLDYHRYTIEWEADEIRWLVDDKLIHVRRAGRPTPIPHLPMVLHASLWPNCSEKLVGPFGPANVPASADFKSIAVSNWHPSPMPHFAKKFDALFSSKSDEPGDWRAHATWIQSPQ